MTILTAGKHTIDLSMPCVMGILNVTADSFHDGGRLDRGAALAHARRMIDEGARIVDVGGESTRPGAAPVDEREELARVIPLVEALADEDICVSVDTMKPAVMRAALDAGASMINDVRALQAPGALAIAADSNAAVCLMHMQGEPRTMQRAPAYADVVAEVRAFPAAPRACLHRRRHRRGPHRRRSRLWLRQVASRIISTCCAIWTRSPRWAIPLLAGLSRKSTIGSITGRDVGDRLAGSIAAALAAALRGARILRVHDVRETVDALAVWSAIEPWPAPDTLPTDGTMSDNDVDGNAAISEPTACADASANRRSRPSSILKLGWAAGRTLAKADGARGERPAVLIGKDTRISGYLLEAALEAGLSAAGVDVYLCGPLPTPAIAYLTRALRLSAGIVISASHNPFDDNGIKFFSGGGAKLPDDVELAIESEMERAARLRALGGARQGVSRRRCAPAATSSSARARFRTSATCAAARSSSIARTAPAITSRRRCSTSSAPTSSPSAIRRTARTSTPVSARRIRRILAEQVRAHGADFGVALDGDGDRLVMADRDGRLYDGDQLLYVIARDYQRRGALAGGVVGTLMSNLGFEQALSQAGIALAAREGRRPLRARAAGRARAGSSAARIPGTSDLPRQAHDGRCDRSPRSRCCAR